MRYDPLKAPDRQEWLVLDEQERTALAQDYARIAGSDRATVPEWIDDTTLCRAWGR